MDCVVSVYLSGTVTPVTGGGGGKKEGKKTGAKILRETSLRESL